MNLNFTVVNCERKRDSYKHPHAYRALTYFRGVFIILGVTGYLPDASTPPLAKIPTPPRPGHGGYWGYVPPTRRSCTFCLRGLVGVHMKFFFCTPSYAHQKLFCSPTRKFYVPTSDPSPPVRPKADKHWINWTFEERNVFAT